MHSVLLPQQNRLGSLTGARYQLIKHGTPCNLFGPLPAWCNLAVVTWQVPTCKNHSWKLSWASISSMPSLMICRSSSSVQKQPGTKSDQICLSATGQSFNQDSDHQKMCDLLISFVAVSRKSSKNWTQVKTHLAQMHHPPAGWRWISQCLQCLE